ncbi:MAG: hypothetical protein HS108_00025 [Planctomycetes bacterium]|jgi:hypothetical protein|nr:hypothetical protein [Planctomycetota bacterium]MCL4731938.1 hypothetical protein [Planctomycetota bacterium]
MDDPLDRLPAAPMSRRRLFMLSGGAVLLGLLALLLVRYAYTFRAGIERRDQRAQLEQIARELSARVRNGEDPSAFTIYSLIGAPEDSRLSPFGEFHMTLAGSAPAYAGTRFTFTSGGRVVITLAVRDVSAADWTLDEEPLPGLLEFWK